MIELALPILLIAIAGILFALLHPHAQDEPCEPESDHTPDWDWPER